MNEFTIDASQGRWESEGVPYNIAVAIAVTPAAEPGDVVLARSAEVRTLRHGQVVSDCHMIPIMLPATGDLSSLWRGLEDRLRTSVRAFVDDAKKHPADPVKGSGVWICAEIIPDDEEKWSFIGVFTDEQLAIEACRNDQCFIAPLALNAVAPLETTEFPGAYFPLLTRDA